MCPPPEILHVIAAHLALLVDGSVELGRVVGLSVQFGDGTRLGSVLVGRTSHLLAWYRLEDV